MWNAKIGWDGGGGGDDGGEKRYVCVSKCEHKLVVSSLGDGENHNGKTGNENNSHENEEWYFRTASGQKWAGPATRQVTGF